MRKWIIAGATLAVLCLAGPASARECGGLQGLQCSPRQYCEYPAGAQCGAADQTGTCKRRPDFCTAQYDPVCGCNDQTYGNACEAARAGASVAYAGECDAPQEPVKKEKKPKKPKKDKTY